MSVEVNRSPSYTDDSETEISCLWTPPLIDVFTTKIGSGMYGVVYSGTPTKMTWNPDIPFEYEHLNISTPEPGEPPPKAPIAIKVINLSRIKDATEKKKQQNAVYNELFVLLRLYQYCRSKTEQHAHNVACLYGFRLFFDGPELQKAEIYSELITGATTLKNCLESGTYTLRQLIEDIVPIIIETLNDLSKQQIHHNDLHAGNLLLQIQPPYVNAAGIKQQRHRVVFIDFGMGCFADLNCREVEPQFVYGGTTNPFTDYAQILSNIVDKLTTGIKEPSPTWPSLLFLYEKRDQRLDVDAKHNPYYRQDRYLLYRFCNFLNDCLIHQRIPDDWHAQFIEMVKPVAALPADLFLDAIIKPDVASKTSKKRKMSPK